MAAERYQRYEVQRPEYLGDEHWLSIGVEVERLERSLMVEDDGQTIGDIKCLVEAVARVTLDIAGTPAGPNQDFGTVVKAAHALLAGQPGQELANESDFGRTRTGCLADRLGNSVQYRPGVPVNHEPYAQVPNQLALAEVVEAPSRIAGP